MLYQQYYTEETGGRLVAAEELCAAGPTVHGSEVYRDLPGRRIKYKLDYPTASFVTCSMFEELEEEREAEKYRQCA